MTDKHTFKSLKQTGRASTDIWMILASQELCGRTIKSCRYLTDEEIDGLGWHDKSLAIFLDDGNYFFVSADDEGNGAGALFTSFDDLETIPTIRA